MFYCLIFLINPFAVIFGTEILLRFEGGRINSLLVFKVSFSNTLLKCHMIGSRLTTCHTEWPN